MTAKENADEILRELDWLRWFRSNIVDALGPGSGDIIDSLRREYQEKGKKLPEVEIDR